MQPGLMRTQAQAALLSMAIVVAAPAVVTAQVFDCGSDGSYGPINVPSGTVTLDLPEDGIFHATTVNVAAGATLRFNRNANNTPVYMLATGDITISGSIDVSGAAGTQVPPVGGKGGPGGFDGGMPAFGAGINPGDGHGPGGARQHASYATVGAGSNAGATYGSPLLVPLVGGSGGGGSAGQPGGAGGGGGGAVLLASNSRVHIGASVLARGAGPFGSGAGYGSGGAVRIVAPIVSGGGLVSVNNPTNQGVGRIRVDAIDRSQMALTFQNNEVVSVGAYMVVFPPMLPTLDIIEVAGTIIPEGSGPVQVFLPFGSDPEQTVTVQAINFAGTVPIRVALIPDSGNRIQYDDCIDMGRGESGQVVVPVTMPINTVTHVQVWTRPASSPCQ